MAWYNSHPELITEYVMIEQNIAVTEELISWRNLSKQAQPIRLQAYQNTYLDLDYDYLFSLRQAKYPLTSLVFDQDVTNIVCGNPKASAAKIRRQLCDVINAWWLAHPERHSQKAIETKYENL